MREIDAAAICRLKISRNKISGIRINRKIEKERKLGSVSRPEKISSCVLKAEEELLRGKRAVEISQAEIEVVANSVVAAAGEEVDSAPADYRGVSGPN